MCYLPSIGPVDTQDQVAGQGRCPYVRSWACGPLRSLPRAGFWNTQTAPTAGKACAALPPRGWVAIPVGYGLGFAEGACQEPPTKIDNRSRG
jgi:hypothetical protein